MMAGNEQGDAMALHLREQVGGEDAGAFFTLRDSAGFLGQAGTRMVVSSLWIKWP